MVVILDGAVVLAFVIIGVATVIDRICVVRIKPDRLVIIFDGAVVLAFGFIGGAAVEERICVVRVKPDGLVAICNGRVAFLLSVPLEATNVKKGSKLTAAISTGINRTCARGYGLVARCLFTRIDIVGRGGRRRQPNCRCED